MIRVLIVSFVPLLMLAAVGACSKDSEPPPRFNDVLSNGSQELPPVSLARPDDDSLPPVPPSRYLKKIGGPAGNPAEAGAERGAAQPAEAARAIVLNDSDAEALVKQFVELSNAGNFEATAAMFVPEQQAAMRKLAVPMAALAKNLTRLQNALKETAPDVTKELQPDEKGIIVLKTEDGTEAPLRVPTTGLEAAGVTPDGEDKATAVVRAGAQGPEQKFELQRIDGKWRIREPNIPTAAEEVAAAATMEDAAAKAFAEVADKLEKNEIQPADVMKEVAAAMKRAMEAARTAPPAAEPTEKTNETPEPAAPVNPAEPARPTNPAEPVPSGDSASAPRTPGRRPGETRSGRDPNNEAPTLEESLGRQ